MPFPIPASVVAQMDELNAVVEQAYQAGDMSRLVETAYHTDAKAMPQGQTPSSVPPHHCPVRLRGLSNTDPCCLWSLCVFVSLQAPP